MMKALVWTLGVTVLLVVGALKEADLTPGRDREFRRIFGTSLTGGYTSGSEEYRKHQEGLRVHVRSVLKEKIEQCERERVLYQKLIANRDKLLETSFSKEEALRLAQDIQRSETWIVESGRRMQATHENCELATVASRMLDGSIAWEFAKHF